MRIIFRKLFGRPNPKTEQSDLNRRRKSCAHDIRVMAYIAILLLALGSVTGRYAVSQVTTADVLGTVSDSTGAIIPGAKVTLKNLGTGVIATTLSNGTGNYLFTFLGPGHYSVTIEAAGFKRAVFADVTLAAGDRSREDGKLELGEAEETIEVTSTAPLLQTDSSSITSVVTEKSVQDLPLNGRNFVSLVTLQPGVTAGQDNAISSGNRPDDRRATSTVSANGMMDLYNNQMIDGMDNNERQSGFIAVRPSIDAIAEVKVDTNSFSAEVGRSAGAVINIITKSGTNNYHGTAYNFFRNDIFDSREYFTRAGVTAKPRYRQNQFGGSVGGPIVKGKTFFFGDAEDNRIVQGVSSGLLTVPTVQENPNCSGNSSGKYDFTDNGGTVLTPSSTLDAVGLAYLKMYPCPNTNGTATSNNYIASNNKTQYALSADGRIDQNFKNGDVLFGRYSYNNVNTYMPGPFPAVQISGETIEPNGALSKFPGLSITKAHNLQFSYVHQIRPNLILELKAGYTRVAIDSENLNSTSSISEKIGLVNVNTSSAPHTNGLMPVAFLSGGYAGLGDSYYLPIINTNNTFQYMGSLTYVKGSHTIKLGAQLTKRQLNYFQSSYPLGYVNFAASSTIGNSMENLLLGTPYSYSRSNSLFTPGYRTAEPAFYIQDDWHINPKLTVNAGLRWEVFTAFTEVHNKYANFMYPTLTLITASNSQHIGINTNYKNFGPRLGFSQSLWKNAVLRGGAAISYYPLPYQSEITVANPPYTASKSCTGYSCGNWWPTLPSSVPSSATDLSGNLTYETSNFNSAYVQQFNLMLQQQVGANVITLGGIGELGRHMYFLTTANLPQPSGPYANVATDGPDKTPSLLTSSTLPKVSSITEYAPSATTNYYALQAVFARRFVQGMAFNANYTWAHGLSDAVSGGAGSELIGAVPSNVRYDYGNSAVDIRHRLAASLNYQLPFGRNAHGILAAIEKGWETNVIWAWQTGASFTIGDSFTNNPSGHTQINLPNVTTERPDVVSTNYRNKTGGITNWLNLSAWTPQQSGMAGNVKNMSLHGPHTRRADMSIVRNIQATDGVKIQFRAECYNISNTPNFNTPNSTISSWTAGSMHDSTHPITNSTANPNLTAVGLLPGDVPNSGGGFGSITSSVSTPRQLQFALKFLF
jgi:hypothetical protein